MIFYNLGFIFRDDCVLLIESRKFPRKFNGFGGIQPDNAIPSAAMEADLKREAGITLARPLTPADMFASMTDWKDFTVNCWKIDTDDDDSFVFDDKNIADPTRKYGIVPLHEVFNNRSEYAPRVAALISLALEYDATADEDCRNFSVLLTK